MSSLTKPTALKRKASLGAGYDDLIPEMLGYEGRRVYVSDGGHYDNLGLLAMLRTKCAEVWSVDASPEPQGDAAELRRVLDIAKDELGVNVAIDLDRFGAGQDGLYRATHASGTITYKDGSQGRLIVVKCGLTTDDTDELKRRRITDRGFPHHSTFLKQAYGKDRFDAYRRLGRDATVRCLLDMEGSH